MTKLEVAFRGCVNLPKNYSFHKTTSMRQFNIAFNTLRTGDADLRFLTR